MEAGMIASDVGVAMQMSSDIVQGDYAGAVRKAAVEVIPVLSANPLKKTATESTQKYVDDALTPH